MRKRKSSAANSNASAETPAAPAQAGFRPTTKQRLYVEDRRAQAANGQWLTQKATAERLHIRESTIADWNQSDPFLAWYAEQLRRGLPPLVEAAKTSIVKRTIDGNVRFAELFCQMYGLTELPGLERPGVGGGVAQAGVSVTFVGLPAPPTRAQVQAQAPPSGANFIIPAPALPAGIGG